MGKDNSEHWSKFQVDVKYYLNRPELWEDVDSNLNRIAGLKFPDDIRLKSTIISNVTEQEVKIPASFHIRFGTPTVTTVEVIAPPIVVPEIGESILYYLCSPERLESVLGDLEENFRKRAAKHGLRAARRWYFWQVTRCMLTCGLRLLRIFIWIREALEKLGL